MTTRVAFGAALNINEVILVARADADSNANRDPREGDTIGQVDVEYGDASWNHYTFDIVLTGGRIDGAAPPVNTSGIDYGWVDSTVAHEFGHHLQYEIGSWDGHSGSHSFCDEVDTTWWNDPEFAWSEGWADYFGTYIARTKPNMSTFNARDAENPCGMINWASSTREDESFYAVEGNVANFLWDLMDGPGQGNDAWDQVDGPAIGGHRTIMQICDHELDDGWSDNVFDDAPDLPEFYEMWWQRFGPAHNYAAGQPVMDPILDRLGIVPGGDYQGAVRKQAPFPVVEGNPSMPNSPQATLNMGGTVVPQYDPPVFSPFVPGNGVVLTIVRHWSYIDVPIPGPNNTLDNLYVKFGASNLGDVTMEVDGGGTTEEASSATYTVQVTYSGGASDWLAVAPISGSFLGSQAPELHDLNLRFKPEVFELSQGTYMADVRLTLNAGIWTHPRTIRVVFEQLSGPDDDWDGDGLSNREERSLATTDPAQYGCLDPHVPDADGDHLPDGDEVNVHGTLPCNPDTDGDGMKDGLEVRYACLDPLVPDFNADPDGDGYSTGDELFGAIPTDPCDGDYDDDGVVDGMDNCRFRANHDQSDIDHDGIGDVCDWNADGDACANIYDPDPYDVDYPDTNCLARPFSPLLTKDGRIVERLDPRLGDPRLHVLVDGGIPTVPNPCGKVDCPPPIVQLLDEDFNVVRQFTATDYGFNRKSGFGITATLIPDLNHDDWPDLAIGVTQAAAGPELPETGAVLLVSGGDGAELARINGQVAHGALGSAMVMLDKSTLALGAPGNADVGGAVHLIDLNSFNVRQSVSPNLPGDSFGSTLLPFARNGQDHLLMGAPDGKGKGIIFWMQPDPASKVYGIQEIGQGDATGDRFGASLAMAGDLNEDGQLEFLIGAPGASPDETLLHAGRASVLSLDGRTLQTFWGHAAGENFGASVDSLLPEMESRPAMAWLIGAPGWNHARGRAYLIDRSGQSIMTIDGDTDGVRLGAQVGVGPDLDQDGFPTFILHEAGRTVEGHLSGRTSVHQTFVQPVMTPILFRPRQQNLWVVSGSGSRPNV